MNWPVLSVVIVFIIINVNCESELAEPSVTIIGCSNSGNVENIKTCTAGNIATIITEFKMPASTKITSLRLEVFLALDMSHSLPYGIDANMANACNHLVGQQCPLNALDNVRHILNLPIHAFKNNGTINLSFKDDEFNLVATHFERIHFAESIVEE